MDTGAVTIDSDGRFGIDHNLIREAVAALTSELMTIQATGDFDAAERILRTHGVVRPEVEQILNRLNTIPIDIQPRFVTADSLTSATP